MDDVKIKVINSDKLINAINEGSYDVNLSAVMALGAISALEQPEPPEPEELDFVQPHKKIGVRLEIGQPEIIQCKDCRHGVDYYHEGDCYCSNPKWGLMYFGGSWEFYCAGAERKTDER